MWRFCLRVANRDMAATPRRVALCDGPETELVGLPEPSPDRLGHVLMEVRGEVDERRRPWPTVVDSWTTTWPSSAPSSGASSMPTVRVRSSRSCFAQLFGVSALDQVVSVAELGLR